MNFYWVGVLEMEGMASGICLKYTRNAFVARNFRGAGSGLIIFRGENHMKMMALGLFTFLWFAGAGFASAKDMTYLGEITDNLCAGAGSHTTMMKNMSLKTPKDCAIACAKSGGKYVLFNKAAKT